MRTARLLFAAALAVLAVSCNREPLPGADSLELSAISVGLTSESGTKATNYNPYVGRGVENANSRYLDFVDGDEIVITNMRRTADPIAKLSYTGFGYKKESGIWSRTAGEPNKVYWSDSVNPHTFVGYSLPSADFPFTTGDNPATTTSVYSGGIAYTSGTPNVADLSDNDKIKTQDLLLLYNTEQRAGDTGEATLVFQHALACVRVIIDIVDYSSQTLDGQTVVSNLVLKDMPVEYTWNQQSSGVTVKDGSAVADLKTWQPTTVQNTFFSLAVPGQTNMVMKFDVTAPHPLYPTDASKNVTHTYGASLADVTLYAGKCTTLNVHLSHNGEEITIGASYQDWEFVDTPDVGALKKNVTFIYTNGGKEDPYDKVTIAGDSGATEDDATWLYFKQESLVDIYGNDGTASKPFKIATANQLVSFSKEVANGRSFDGQYVMLDASLTLQEVKSTSSSYVWHSIGADGKPFNGTFFGGARTISKISGNPLFGELGSSARVEDLILLECAVPETALALSNAGTICGVRVEGASKFVVNTNTGSVFASSITGSNATAMVKGSGADGGDATKVVASFCGGATSGYFYGNGSAVSKTKGEMILQGFVTDLNNAISNSTSDHKANHSYKFVAGSYPLITDTPLPAPDPNS